MQRDLAFGVFSLKYIASSRAYSVQTARLSSPKRHGCILES